MFSQNQEEAYIERYFGNYVGTFLDIGAYDGKTFSNTHLLALRGWSGVLVEPSPAPFQKLKDLYEGNDNLFIANYAIGDFDGEIEFYDANGDAISTTSKEHVEHWKQWCDYKTITVEQITLATLLENIPIKHFDFVNIDTEGGDERILAQMNLVAFRTKLLCVEIRRDLRDVVVPQLYLKGFRLIYDNDENILMGLKWKP